MGESRSPRCGRPARPGCGPGAAEHRPQAARDGVTADVHRAGHLAVAGPGGYQAQDLEFPFGAVPGTAAPSRRRPRLAGGSPLSAQPVPDTPPTPGNSPRSSTIGDSWPPPSCPGCSSRYNARPAACRQRADLPARISPPAPGADTARREPATCSSSPNAFRLVSPTNSASRRCTSPGQLAGFTARGPTRATPPTATAPADAVPDRQAAQPASDRFRQLRPDGAARALSRASRYSPRSPATTAP